MTDLEMTKLCAEAMGIDPSRVGLQEWSDRPYDPLYNGAQVFELIVEFGLVITKTGCIWTVMNPLTENANLKRAIVECVAKMQARKKS